MFALAMNEMAVTAMMPVNNVEPNMAMMPVLYQRDFVDSFRPDLRFGPGGLRRLERLRGQAQRRAQGQDEEEQQSEPFHI